MVRVLWGGGPYSASNANKSRNVSENKNQIYKSRNVNRHLKVPYTFQPIITHPTLDESVNKLFCQLPRP